MPEIVLHHHATSTFSERVRLALGLKGLSWRSVDIPAAMPKPDLVPLTGGYRRTPVTQLGADVLCGTRLLLRRIEALHPEPSLYPGGSEGLADALAWWADRALFAPALGLVADADRLPPAFVAERKAFGFPLAREEVGPVVPRHLQQGAAHLASLAAMLRDGRPFLLGAAPSAADLAAFGPLWLLRQQGGPGAGARLPLGPARAWCGRVEALGHGRPAPMPAAEALDVALRSEPEVPPPRDADPSGPKPGEAVSVTPAAASRSAACCSRRTPRRSWIRHAHPRVGAVNLHFPRAGFDVARA